MGRENKTVFGHNTSGMIGRASCIIVYTIISLTIVQMA